MREFLAVCATPVMVGILQWATHFDLLWLFCAWCYVFFKTTLVSSSLCIKNVQTARVMFYVVHAATFAVELVVLAIYASFLSFLSFLSFNVWALVGCVLIGTTANVLAVVRCGSGTYQFVVSQQEWEHVFCTAQPNNKSYCPCLFVVNILWSLVLGLLVPYLYVDIGCISWTAYDVFFLGMMVCWVWTSLLMIQIVGALANKPTHEEHPSTLYTHLVDVVYVNPTYVCRLKKIYTGFAFLFLFSTALLGINFSWIESDFLNSTCLNSTFTNSSEEFPYISHIEGWATLGILTMAAIIPTAGLCMVNFGTFFALCCQ